MIRKKILLFLLTFSVFSFSSLNAQLGKDKLSLKFHPGLSQYTGPLGNGAFKFADSDWNLGISLGTSLSKSFNFELLGSVSSLNYSYKGNLTNPSRPILSDGTSSFSSILYDGKALIHYKLANGTLFPREAAVQPFIYSGVGLSRANNQTDFIIPVGGGLGFKINDEVGITLRTTYNHAFNDDYKYWQHSLGLVFSLCKGCDSDSKTCSKEGSKSCSKDGGKSCCKAGGKSCKEGSKTCSKDGGKSCCKAGGKSCKEGSKTCSKSGKKSCCKSGGKSCKEGSKTCSKDGGKSCCKAGGKSCKEGSKSCSKSGEKSCCKSGAKSCKAGCAKPCCAKGAKSCKEGCAKPCCAKGAKSCKEGCAKPCCMKGAKSCKAGCVKPCCAKGAKSCKEGCTKPCCKSGTKACKAGCKKACCAKGAKACKAGCKKACCAKGNGSAELKAPLKLDTDGDGVPDKLDACPSLPGVAELLGCPDTDGDGIADSKDKCPNAKGTILNGGCPGKVDSDGDGVEDKLDKCPKVKGVAALGGCPDKDGDGVTDAKDLCPSKKGTKAASGCPDKDGDGVADSKDNCPNSKGSKATKGCPDSDGDGINDKDDSCPKVKGIAANNGCPKVNEAVKNVLNQAMEGIEFETGTDVIRTRSYPILDQMVQILKDNPGYKLNISGHTDNVGDPAANLNLSLKRAFSAKNYLGSHGVDFDRITAEGFGDGKPLVPNDSNVNRQKNRRVEFKILF